MHPSVEPSIVGRPTLYIWILSRSRDLWLSQSAPAQNTYVWELTHSTNFPWLDPVMAEELRNNIEALRLLEQEQNQVCRLLSPSSQATCFGS